MEGESEKLSGQSLGILQMNLGTLAIISANHSGLKGQASIMLRRSHNSHLCRYQKKKSVNMRPCVPIASRSSGFWALDWSQKLSISMINFIGWMSICRTGSGKWLLWAFITVPTRCSRKRSVCYLLQTVLPTCYQEPIHICGSI